MKERFMYRMRAGRTLRRLGTSLILLGVALGAGAPAWGARMEMGTLAPKNSSYHRALLAMGQEWRDAPGGGVRLRVFPSGVIGSESDMVREMRLGGIQAALLTATGLGEIEPSVAGFQSLPMMFRSLEEFEFVYQHIQPTLEERLRAKDFVVLFWSDGGWVHFFSRNPLLRPADLKPMKIFTSVADPRTADMWRSGGYQPVLLEPTDILTGLQTGMIDVVAVPPVFAMATRIDDPAKHMLDLKWAPLIGAAVVYRPAWERLPEETRAYLHKSAGEAAQKIVTRGRTEAQESIEAMRQRGLVVHHADVEIERLWREEVESMYPQLRGGLVPEDIFDEVQRLLKEYRSGR